MVTRFTASESRTSQQLREEKQELLTTLSPSQHRTSPVSSICPPIRKTRFCTSSPTSASNSNHRSTNTSGMTTSTPATSPHLLVVLGQPLRHPLTGRALQERQLHQPWGLRSGRTEQRVHLPSKMGQGKARKTDKNGGRGRGGIKGVCKYSQISLAKREPYGRTRRMNKTQRGKAGEKFMGTVELRMLNPGSLLT